MPLWRQLSLIKIRFGVSLKYTFGRFVFKFHKYRMGDDVNVTSFKFTTNNCQYLKSYSTYKIIKGQGHNSRSYVTDLEVSAFLMLLISFNLYIYSIF